MDRVRRGATRAAGSGAVPWETHREKLNTASALRYPPKRVEKDARPLAVLSELGPWPLVFRSGQP